MSGEWIRRHWPDLGAVLFAALAFWMAAWGGAHLSPVRALLVVNLMALLCHQVEEYRLPGGAPIIINIATYGEREAYDRYPGNTASIAVVNICAWCVYTVAIVADSWIWLGLAVMFFGFTQVLGHGILMNVKTKGLYNPGLVTALVLHLPIGIAYILEIERTGLASTGAYIGGLVGVIALFALTVVAPVQGMKDRETPFVIPAEEANRFHMVDKLRARGVI